MVEHLCIWEFYNTVSSHDSFIIVWTPARFFVANLIQFLVAQADVDNVGSDVDLNSLIEGDVDEDDSIRDDEGSRTPVISYYAPLKVKTVIKYTGCRVSQECTFFIRSKL